MVATALILGPVVTAVTTNVFLYGICVVQWANYYRTGYTDRKLISFLVAWVILLDTFHTAASVYMLWDYVVTNFNNPAILSAAPWPFPSTPIVTVFASVPIQIFLAWRIRQLSHSFWLFAILAVCSFAQGALGCAGAIGALQTPNIDQFTHLIPLVDSWLAIAVLTDGMITILLTRYLWLSRTGRSRTDHVIWRIIRSAVETAAFGSFFCVMDLVTFTALQSTNFHLIFALPMGRLYTNTLMTTLNNRVSFRSQLEQGGGETSFNVATDQFAEANAHPVKMTHLKFKSLQSPETIAAQGGADLEHDIGDGDGDGEHGGDHSSELKVVPVI